MNRVWLLWFIIRSIYRSEYRKLKSCVFLRRRTFAITKLNYHHWFHYRECLYDYWFSSQTKITILTKSIKIIKKTKWIIFNSMNSPNIIPTIVNLLCKWSTWITLNNFLIYIYYLKIYVLFILDKHQYLQLRYQHI